MRGHSLLELVISLMIVIVVIFGVFAVFPLTQKATRQSMSMANLSFLAQLKIEALKSKQFCLKVTDPLLREGDYEGNFGDDLSDNDFAQYNYTLKIEDLLKSNEYPDVVLLKKAVITAYGPGPKDNPDTSRVEVTAYIRMYDTATNQNNGIVIGPAPFPLPPGRKAQTVYNDYFDPAGKVDQSKFTPEQKKLTRFYPVSVSDKTRKSGCKLSSEFKL